MENTELRKQLLARFKELYDIKGSKPTKHEAMQAGLSR